VNQLSQGDTDLRLLLVFIRGLFIIYWLLQLLLPILILVSKDFVTVSSICCKVVQKQSNFEFIVITELTAQINMAITRIFQHNHNQETTLTHHHPPRPNPTPILLCFTTWVLSANNLIDAEEERRNARQSLSCIPPCTATYNPNIVQWRNTKHTNEHGKTVRTDSSNDVV
jgi:predicted ABC-type exoprotein transport system permease subunit